MKTQTKTSKERIPGDALDYASVAVDLIRALRGRRSRAAFSRRMGYRSNVVHRWETQRSWPSAAIYLQLRRRLHGAEDYFTRFFQRTPSWLKTCEPDSPTAVAAFLRQLKGKTPIGVLARQSGFSRYQLSRWLSGAAQPPLPAFLRVVEASSRRVLDLLALLTDPEQLPSVVRRWRQLELTRTIAYEKPWSHAVLRALELEGQPIGAAQLPWLADKLGIPVSTVEDCLSVLLHTGQVTRRRRRYVLTDIVTVSTARDPSLARMLKAEWMRTALWRLEQGNPGHSGYSLFAISRHDLHGLRALHADYVRAMQEVIARSSRSECVGLFCVHLLDLASSDNALAESPNDTASSAGETANSPHRSPSSTRR